MQIADSVDGERETSSAAELELSAILDSCDPIGVYDGSDPSQQPGEYDDLVRPVIQSLSNGTTEAALIADLVQVLRVDYGLAPEESPAAAARQIVRWSNVRGAPS